MDGTYDEAYDLSIEATEEYGWYNRNAAVNPFQEEGKRIVGLETRSKPAKLSKRAVARRSSSLMRRF